MTGEGIKQVYQQMEGELDELRNPQDSTFNPQPEKWEPPSLERIKKRMGMKS